MSLVETPDGVEDHHPDVCGGCGASLAGAASEGYVRRQVADIPPVALETVEHRVHRAVCPGCGAVSAGRFPEGVKVPAQYGPGVRSTVRYLSAAQMMPRRRLAGLIERPVRRIRVPGNGFFFARQRSREVFRLRRACRRLGGEGRGDAAADVTGIAVHDFQQPYWNIAGVSHGRCVAHILRGLDALTEFHGEAWSAEMRKLLQGAVRAGEPLSAEAADRIEREYDGIVAAAVAWHGELPPPDGGKRKRRGRRKNARA